MTIFIDSTILMYVAGGDREPSRRFLDGVRRRKLKGRTSTEVLQEILYRYSALGRREVAPHVYDLFLEICPVVLGVTLAETDRARDAVHAALMLNHGVERIASFDRGFDDIPGVHRVEPGGASNGLDL